MTALVDTNVFIGHLAGDPPEPAERASAYLADAGLLVLPDLILAEIVCVVESFSRVPTSRVVQAARAVVACENVKTADLAVLWRAIEVYGVHRVDSADAYNMAAYAETTDIDDIASLTGPSAESARSTA